jgi:hypothetical protein
MAAAILSGNKAHVICAEFKKFCNDGGLLNWLGLFVANYRVKIIR